MRAATIVPRVMTTTLLLALALAQAPAKVDLSKDLAKLRVVTDGKKHYLVYDPSRGSSGDFYYGSATTLAKLQLRGGSARGDESFDVSLWEPRVIPGVQGYASFEMKEKGAVHQVTCAKKVTPLSVVPDAEAQKLLAGATFTEHLWQRIPERLLRDDRGVYYYVDRFRSEERGDRRDFRLYVGPKGQMKVQPLKDIVDDTEGMIFSTATGDLRLVANRVPADFAERDKEKDKAAPMKWVSGKTEVPLLEVPIDAYRNVRMIYMELGPYDGQRLGSPCDDLM